MHIVVWVFYAIVLIIMATPIVIVARCYKKCPSDKIMVIYGKVGTNEDGTARQVRCIHGGAAFIFPMIQAYQFLDINPISIQIEQKSLVTKGRDYVDIQGSYTVAISTTQQLMYAAAERLLGLEQQRIGEMAKDIILAQVSQCVAQFEYEQLHGQKDIFLQTLAQSIESQINLLGLTLVNINIAL